MHDVARAHLLGASDRVVHQSNSFFDSLNHVLLILSVSFVSFGGRSLTRLPHRHSHHVYQSCAVNLDLLRYEVVLVRTRRVVSTILRYHVVVLETSGVVDRRECYERTQPERTHTYNTSPDR